MCDENRLWYEGYRRNSMDSDGISFCLFGSIHKKKPDDGFYWTIRTDEKIKKDIFNPVVL